MILSSDQANIKKKIHFDISILPDILRRRVEDVSNELGTPPEMAAIAGIAMLGGAISNKCGIKQEQFSDWTLVPNLWGAVVAPSGSNKSAVISAMSNPILSEEHKESDRFEEEHRQYLSDRKKYEISIKEYTKKAKFDDTAEEPKAPRKPKRKRFLINDATHEMIGEILKDADQGVIALHDELGGLLASFGSQARAGSEARSFYLGSWNGDGSYHVDRIGRGSFFIKNYCISIFGGIQPSLIDKLVQQAINGDHSDGFLERFQLFIYPEFCEEYHECNKFEDKDIKKKYGEVSHTLLTFDPTLFGAKKDFDDSRPFFRYSKEAQIAYREWDRARHVRQMEARRNKQYVFESSISKQKVLIGSLALIFHVFEIASGNITPSFNIDIINFERASKMVAFLEQHMHKIYSRHEAMEDEANSDIQAIVDWCHTNQKLIEDSMLTPSTIGQKINKKYRSKIVEEALAPYIEKRMGKKIIRLKF